MGVRAYMYLFSCARRLPEVTRHTATSAEFCFERAWWVSISLRESPVYRIVSCRIDFVQP